MEQSALQMVLQAGYIVKCVLIILLIFSVTSWTIIFYKWRLFSKADDENATFMNIYNVSKSTKYLYTSSKKFKLSPLARLFKSVYSEKAYTDNQ
jgi:biopolymer transport protein TolQ